MTPFERLRAISPRVAEAKLNEVIHEFDLKSTYTVDEVYVAGDTRAAVGEVEAYGLVIQLDAMGRAVSISHVDGFTRDVIEWQETV